MPKKTFLTCLGTRPEIIKMAPVYKALKARGQHVQIVHTGQHEAVAHELYRFFDMPPDIVIDLQRKSPALAHLTAALTDGLAEAVRTLKPDVILVQGDTSSAFVGALTGYYDDIPVAHVEAGLRTHQRDPFPEEKNRELIGRLAHWHFPPTEQARENLRVENISTDNIFMVGNTVIDAALWTRDRLHHLPRDNNPAIPESARDFLLQHRDDRLILITAHRRENWGAPIRQIAQAAGAIVAQHEDVIVVWPVHPNPTVRSDVEREISALPPSVRERICLTDPLDYPALIDLLVRCHFTLTDSGGIQEEASAFAKPVLIARTSTERQELVNAGGALLVGTDVDEICRHARLLLEDSAAYRRMQVRQSPFGDGHAAQRIAAILAPAISRGAEIAR
ncbi:non-hydrolyzing UDP-N-acetylglucosamine 2-epimerase [Actimicrobium sp. CCI2.3]|uniref:non-hydrolyzing UDP-N-acetylglucosamine 2-epimerase n=1 Tax=Actimicrobium sp. CCI2.3 TaxID=3048616 RepID=UPI002AB47EAC|nr:UDP-N-acetylglucosamine 2-epimerase (non-hydrolyzing) [Actimicrobium sp. CCI2.3]MDY7575213.1 UDP-N-acetylglucosamine 2-epimerase (non-hydrolyzing) [Actimicrobium sp. CCI2.3]MEB0022324.1 UDP-N-acetylglucosamine 2-epimerase (non-hydrolyzing) [Actimicrobium sp. CCI2.3]